MAQTTQIIPISQIKEESINQPQIVYSEPLLNSFLTALFIDVPVTMVLGGSIPLALFGATTGYTFRYYCGEYMGSDHPFKAAVCGSIGGAMKYSISKATLAKEVLVLGGYNNYLYEYFGKLSDELTKASDWINLSSIFIRIEVAEGILQTAGGIIMSSINIGTKASLESITDGFYAGGAVALTSFFIYEEYAKPTHDFVLPYLAEAENYVFSLIHDPALNNGHQMHSEL